MSIPEDIRIAITVSGVVFELHVQGVPQYFEHGFPMRLDGDQSQMLRGVGKAALQEAGVVLEEAAQQFLHKFLVSSRSVLEVECLRLSGS